MTFNGYLPPGSKTAAMLAQVVNCLASGGEHLIVAPRDNVPYLKEQLLARARGVVTAAFSRRPARAFARSLTYSFIWSLLFASLRRLRRVF